MKTITIYLEGGGDTDALRCRCREGFQKLFDKCAFKRRPKLVACGGRGKAFDRFCTAQKLGEEVALLLVDSEDPMSDIEHTWEHLKTRDNWTKPENATDEQVLMMTTCMETWIVTDRAALRSHYGSSLNENQLPALNNLESRDRHAIQESLERATSTCSNKYEKGKKSFQILSLLSRSTLEGHLPSFVRDMRILEATLWF